MEKWKLTVFTKVFGNRFRNTSYEKMRNLENANPKMLKEADEFIRQNLGEILQGDSNFTEKYGMYKVKMLV